MNRITSQLLRSHQEIRFLQKEWDRLLVSSEHASPFLSFEWLDAWYRSIGHKQCSLLFLAAFSNQRLVGLVPFVIYRKRFGPFRWRTLGFAGQDYSYHLGLVVEKNFSEALAIATAKFMFKAHSKYDYVELAHCFSNPVFEKILAKGCRDRQWHFTKDMWDSCKVFIGTGGFDDYLSNFKGKTRQKYHRYLRALEEECRIETDTLTRISDFNRYWDKFLELHLDAIDRKSAKSLLEQPSFQRFYWECLRIAVQRGTLRIIAFHKGLDLIALMFGVRHGKRIYYFNLGYREYSHYSFGKMLLLVGIRSALSEGVHYVDYLGGGAAYKNSLFLSDEDGARIRIKKSKGISFLDMENIARRSKQYLANRFFCK